MRDPPSRLCKQKNHSGMGFTCRRGVKKTLRCEEFRAECAKDEEGVQGRRGKRPRESDVVGEDGGIRGIERGQSREGEQHAGGAVRQPEPFAAATPQRAHMPRLHPSTSSVPLPPPHCSL